MRCDRQIIKKQYSGSGKVKEGKKMTITATKPFCDGIVPDNLAKYCKRFLDPAKVQFLATGYTGATTLL